MVSMMPLHKLAGATMAGLMLGLLTQLNLPKVFVISIIAKVMQSASKHSA